MQETNIEWSDLTWNPTRGCSRISPGCKNCYAEMNIGEIDLTGIDWAIVGSESGHDARPCNHDWVRFIRDQCVAAGVAFFYKQDAFNGRKIPTPELDGQKWLQFPKAVRV